LSIVYSKFVIQYQLGVIYMHYGKRLKELMREKRMTQEQLSLILKEKQQNISNWLNVESPTIDKAVNICGALGLEPYELFISKEYYAKNTQIPEHLVDYVIFLKKQKPEMQELLIDMAFKIIKAFENQVAS
jgi:transcriptional regulator with XRE-family HTH domain